tara:strand:- start:497 stop:802 length:306 start_codon:yes stop_codon:yes gene_type:complete
MNDQAITKLIKILLDGSNVSYRLRKKLRLALDPDEVAIWWSVSDVEHIAANEEEAYGVPIGSRYDRSQFLDLLEDCCAHSEYGVTTETIQDALEYNRQEGE